MIYLGIKPSPVTGTLRTELGEDCGIFNLFTFSICRPGKSWLYEYKDYDKR